MGYQGFAARESVNFLRVVTYSGIVLEVSAINSLFITFLPCWCLLFMVAMEIGVVACQGCTLPGAIRDGI